VQTAGGAVVIKGKREKEVEREKNRIQPKRDLGRSNKGLIETFQGGNAFNEKKRNRNPNLGINIPYG